MSEIQARAILDMRLQRLTWEWSARRLSKNFKEIIGLIDELKENPRSEEEANGGSSKT